MCAGSRVTNPSRASVTLMATSLPHLIPPAHTDILAGRRRGGNPVGTGAGRTSAPVVDARPVNTDPGVAALPEVAGVKGTAFARSLHRLAGWLDRLAGVATV